MTLDSASDADEFMLDLDGIIAFINKQVPSQDEKDVWEEPYQGLPDSPDMYNANPKLRVGGNIRKLFTKGILFEIISK